MPPPRVRCWCFTWFPPVPEGPHAQVVSLQDGLNHLATLSEDPDFRYIIAGEEVCPETGRAHLQGYVEFHRAFSLTSVKDAFGWPTAHFEPRRGTQEQAIDYCKKEGNFHEWGKPVSVDTVFARRRLEYDVVAVPLTVRRQVDPDEPPPFGFTWRPLIIDDNDMIGHDWAMFTDHIRPLNNPPLRWCEDCLAWHDDDALLEHAMFDDLLDGPPCLTGPPSPWSPSHLFQMEDIDYEPAPLR